MAERESDAENRPGGLGIGLLRLDLRLGLRFGYLVSVKLWKALDGGIHGSLGRKSSRSSGDSEVKVAGDAVDETAQIFR